MLECPAEAMCQGLGCCCHHCDAKTSEAPLLLALPVEKQATMASSSPPSTTQVNPGTRLLGFGLVEQSRVRCSWWGKVQLPSGRRHWLHQHFSTQRQMWWFKPPVAEVSLTSHWNKVEERTCTAGSEMCPDQNRQVHWVTGQSPRHKPGWHVAMPVLINRAGAAAAPCFVAE